MVLKEKIKREGGISGIIGMVRWEGRDWVGELWVK